MDAHHEFADVADKATALADQAVRISATLGTGLVVQVASAMCDFVEDTIKLLHEIADEMEREIARMDAEKGADDADAG